MPVSAYDTTERMAAAAAAEAAEVITGHILRRGEANVVFAGAESQQAFHRALSREAIDWPNLRAFSVDEFVSPDLPEACAVGAQTKRDLYAHVPIGETHGIDFHAEPETERLRYEKLLAAHPPDIACLGIGVSGHLALNEPNDTNFSDPQMVRIAKLCDASIKQLESDPNFRDLPAIPKAGITMTMPAIMHVKHVIVVVPYAIKAATIARMLKTDVTPTLPASMLRTHPSAHLFLDHESSSALDWNTIETDSVD